MSPAEEPLLAREQSSDQSEEQGAAEEEALLGNRLKDPRASHNKYGFWRELALFLWAVIATAALIVLAVLYSHREQTTPDDSRTNKPSGKRNLVFMVSDGMGPASFRQYRDGLPIDDILVLDQHLIGSSRTRATNSLVTDSAAGATAFSCGLKSYNGAISMLPDHTPCGTVLEAAKRAGYMTGLVVTTDITDATPACFASHVNHRIEEDSIAAQEVGEHPLGRVVDLILGGGRCHFLPNISDDGCRADDRDITKLAQEKYGWSYIDNREDFDGLDLGSSVKLPLLGLFAERDIPYEIDRKHQKNQYPSLKEMAQTALRALEAATQDSDKGFFLLIEGSRIDHAGHSNDPAAQVNEVLAYDETFAAVIKFLEESDVEGVAVSTSDHETGGLAVSRQLHTTYPQYLWYPQALTNASHSAEHLASRLYKYVSLGGESLSKQDLDTYVRKTIVEEGLGIVDAKESEIQLVITYATSSSYILSDMVSRRAQIGWSTHGHSAVDVNIYGSKGTETLRGNHENTEIGEFLRNYLDVDVRAITEELNDKAKKSSENEGESDDWTVVSKEDAEYLRESEHWPVNKEL